MNDTPLTAPNPTLSVDPMVLSERDPAEIIACFVDRLNQFTETVEALFDAEREPPDLLDAIIAVTAFLNAAMSLVCLFLIRRKFLNSGGA